MNNVISNRVASRTLALSSEAYRRVSTLTVLRQAQHKPGVDDPQASNPAGWFARTYAKLVFLEGVLH
ncbi:MAG: hypothetical protein AB1607_14470 [Chloroflexota bacterium]